MSQRKINHLMNYMKGIACICVIFMHCEFPGRFGVLVQCVARFCVPFFFMVSGYFCYRKTGEVDYGKKIRHIGFITLAASVVYLLVTPLYATTPLALPSLGAIIKWVVFNLPYYIAGQLWFLYALLYDYIIFAVLDKLKWKKLINVIIPAGIIAYIVLAQGAHLLGYKINSMIYRNFLIEGLPLFCLGYWIHEHEDGIRIPEKWLLAGLILSTVLCPVERLLLGRDFGVNIVTFVQVFCLFLLCVRFPDVGKDRRFTRFGAECSLYVYLIHPGVWHLIDKAYQSIAIQDNTAALYVRPLLCLLFSALLAVCYVYLKSLLRKNKNNRQKVDAGHVS